MAPVAVVRTVVENGREYRALAFICPGCAAMGGTGLHMLPIDGDTDRPRWGWDGDLLHPTLSPSILTRYGDGVCHSFLREGVFDFLPDSTHPLAGLRVPLPDLPAWVADD